MRLRCHRSQDDGPRGGPLLRSSTAATEKMEVIEKIELMTESVAMIVATGAG
jgi:hypothetical protein